MKRFKPKMEILPVAQQRLWPELAAAQKLGFVLYGGTAIALRLGHRPSVDFDFFSDKPLDRAAIRASFPFIEGSTVLQDRENTFEVLVPYGESRAQHVKVSFFGMITVGRVGEPQQTDDGVMQVASLDDLMAMKVKVLLQRVEAKDYRDIAALVQAGISLPRGLASARAMWGEQFQPSESLKALVYFEGGDLYALTPNEKEVLVNAASAVRDLPKVEIAAVELRTASFDCADDDRDDDRDGDEHDPLAPRFRM
ncbi:nucleotidyl transferase AbiEii/AbiGii toxin family protein [Burkholderia contaminans]|uniref:nucleotidyl transferase AbiEii/AbiGii toxin family protein n=1 Tax=Burkholderia contaminans TaxID=488447 RepID=UPI001CF569C2|nr:nucleotidyl transferase AbiEii/AbiGii toxin family protein [Burkholderia contaminans]MCA7889041.1 nucleotidyl transferase AbiEii/AbiGii toxin family protein [Burkholderia contaminans]